MTVRTLLRSSTASMAAVVTASLISGCSGSPKDLAPVKGTVKMDGEPLKDALVTFTPKAGSTSYGRTDGNGKYELVYNRDTKGAEIGKHVVSISTKHSGDEDADPPVAASAETVPERYNIDAAGNPEMNVEVQAGKNTHDFDLSSKKDKSRRKKKPRRDPDNC